MSLQRFVSLAVLSSLMVLDQQQRGVQAISCASVSCEASGSFYTYKYGTSKTSSGYFNQVGDLYLPASFTPNTPIVVLVHGGYWGETFIRNAGGANMSPLADQLITENKYAVVNIEYRRASTYPGGEKGGFPGTFNDMVNGVDALECIATAEVSCGTGQDFGNLDLDRIVMVGHSAGGHLALWRTLEVGLTDTQRTTYSSGVLDKAVLNPIAAVGLAPVTDFAGPCGGDGSANGDAINSLMGAGDQTFSPSYCGNTNDFATINGIVSPLAMVAQTSAALTSSTSIPMKMVHALGDTIVSVLQSTRFEDECYDVSNPNVRNSSYYFSPGNHFNVITATDDSWTQGVVPFLDDVFTASSPPSESPTKAPVTPAPSSSPSTKPSLSPSMPPTSAAPTTSPSRAPSASPSTKPSLSPSMPPTSADPTTSPSRKPSSTPSVLPSREPSHSPSSRPIGPTVAPVTAEPTPVPTPAPSTSPTTTSAPSTTPSVSPTKTQHPSTAPSTSPSQSPSESPTTTVAPSVTPSLRPTRAPTPVPTTSKPTAAPTPAPAPAPTGVCFATDSSTVHVKGKGVVSIMDVALNDLVLSNVDDGETFSKVYAFGQRSRNHNNQMIQLQTACRDVALELTPDHMVFLADADLPVTASRVRVGDRLKVVVADREQLTSEEEQDDCAIVQNVSEVTKQGFITPITVSGTIVVNGIVASTYAGKHGSEEYLQQESSMVGGLFGSLLHYQHISHLAVAPLRFSCTWISGSLCREGLHVPDDDSGDAAGREGQHVFFGIVHQLKHFVKSEACGPVLHAILFALVLGIGLTVSVFEWALLFLSGVDVVVVLVATSSVLVFAVITYWRTAIIKTKSVHKVKTL